MRGIIIFTFIALITSCSGEGDEIEPLLALKEIELELVCEDTDTLQVVSQGIEVLQWDIDNDFSIIVDNKGIVKANRVGETVVTVKDRDSELQSECIVNVIAKYNTYVEPPLLLGSNQEEVKNEIEKLSNYSYLFGTDAFINYNYSDDNISMLICRFNENKLTSLLLNIKETNDIINFLSERYKLISTSGEGTVTYSFVNKDDTMSVIYKEESSKVGSTITYAPMN